MKPIREETSLFNTKFFPQHILLLSVADNLMPMGYWTVISKEPFRFLICMQHTNETLNLLRKYNEAALHFMPWKDREKVVRAGFISARDVNKAEHLGFTFKPAQSLKVTRLVEGFDSAYETTVFQELKGLSSEFALFVLDVTAVHGTANPVQRQPILFFSLKDFGTVGERWKFQQ